MEHNKNDYDMEYRKTRTRHLIMMCVIFGAINTSLLYFDTNIISMISNFIEKYLFSGIDKLFYVLIFVSTIVLLQDRTTWLPFLGTTVIPEKILTVRENKNSINSIPIKTQPFAKIIFWSAIPRNDTDTPNVIDAYGDYSNSGITQADEYGNAILKINKGTGYIVPNGKYIKPHLHYRIINNNSSIMSDVKTLFFN